MAPAAMPRARWPPRTTLQASGKMIQLERGMQNDERETDGGYNSAAVDAAMRENKVEQIQTAIRGRKPAAEKLGLDDFEWETDSGSQPLSVTCPQGQQASVELERQAGRYRVPFEASACAGCPLSARCPTRPLKRKPEQVLRFSQAEVDLALRRQRSARDRASGQNLRTAVEATVRAVKHPFGNGKVPVRGKARVSMVMIGSAAMNNVRRIHRHLTDPGRAGRAEKGPRKGQAVPHNNRQFLFLPCFGPRSKPVYAGPAFCGQLWPVKPKVLSVES